MTTYHAIVAQLERKPVLFLSVAVSANDFSRYDLCGFTSQTKTDLSLWCSAYRLPTAALHYVNACDARALPEPGEFCGVLIGGSLYSVNEDLMWQRRILKYLRNAYSKDVLMLGVCGGHQLLAVALGGRVGKNRAGHHVGAFPVTLSALGAEDELFCRLPRRVALQFAHADSISVAPKGATVLACADHDPYAALRIGNRTWSVQFHLELQLRHMKSLVGFNERHTQALQIGDLRETFVQRRIFWNWLRLAVGVEK